MTWAFSTWWACGSCLPRRNDDGCRTNRRVAVPTQAPAGCGHAAGGWGRSRGHGRDSSRPTTGLDYSNRTPHRRARWIRHRFWSVLPCACATSFRLRFDGRSLRFSYDNRTPIGNVAVPAGMERFTPLDNGRFVGLGGFPAWNFEGDNEPPSERAVFSVADTGGEWKRDTIAVLNIRHMGWFVAVRGAARPGSGGDRLGRGLAQDARSGRWTGRLVLGPAWRKSHPGATDPVALDLPAPGRLRRPRLGLFGGAVTSAARPRPAPGAAFSLTGAMSRRARTTPP